MKRSKRAQERQQRGRRIVLWGLAAVALAQIAAGLLLDYKWPGVRFPRADVILARWQEAPARPDIVFFGSSRFEGSVWPEVVDADLAKCFAPAPHCFNAALPGGDAGRPH